ncbi:MAG: glycosyltransferase family 2 protein [Pirellulales bacterium]
MLTESNHETVSAPARDCRQALAVSVIVPVRNEAKFINRTLAQLITQDYDSRRFEVLVVDGQSTDGTPDLVARVAAQHHNVRLLENPRRLSSAARNIAIREARGDVVVIVDGHCELGSTHYLSNLVDAFERSGADCIGRPQPQDIAGATALQRAIAAARSSRLGHHPDSFIYSSAEGFVPAKSVAVAYRRSVFDEIGPFDETFDACEDVELNHRIDHAGLRCFFTPTVTAHYAPRDTLRGLFRQLVRYGRGRVRLLRKHPETLTIKTLLPGIFVLGGILGLGLACLAPWLAATYLAAIAVYLVVVFGVSLAVAIARRDAPILPWLPLVFFTVHCAAGAGMWLEAVTPGRRRCCSRQDVRVA